MSQEYLAIIDILHAAKKTIQYPKITLRNTFTLQLAGAKAQFPMSVNITDGKPYGSNQWYGRIMRNGNLQMPNTMQAHGEDLQVELHLFMENPAQYAKLYGSATGNCMFCRKHLTDPQSVAVGYGPICANHYNLPHGEMEQGVAESLAQIELDMPEVKPQVAIIDEKFMHVYSMLNQCCELMLSSVQWDDLEEQLQKHTEDVKTKYALMVTALWEHTI